MKQDFFSEIQSELHSSEEQKNANNLLHNLREAAQEVSNEFENSKNALSFTK